MTNSTELLGLLVNGSLTQKTFDHYIRTFQFIGNKTLLSTWMTPLLVTVGFLLTLRVLRNWIKRSKPYDLQWLLIIHNSIMAILSGILLIGLTAVLYSNVQKTSLWTVFCDEEKKFLKGPIYWYYYMNYVLKFWELFDTVLLVLRNKPTPFLHVYHHIATLILCWSQLRAHSCLQWVPITLNLAIHTIMYTYYTLAALKIHVWWKKHLTALQIVQFVIDVIACFIGLSSRSLNDLGWKSFPLCQGEYVPSFFGLGILLSYLLLFTSFFQERYKEKDE